MTLKLSLTDSRVLPKLVQPTHLKKCAKEMYLSKTDSTLLKRNSMLKKRCSLLSKELSKQLMMTSDVKRKKLETNNSQNRETKSSMMPRMMLKRSKTSKIPSKKELKSSIIGSLNLLRWNKVKK
jgi:hypothetical protein